MAKFFLELSLVSYSMLAYLPSQMAASALYLARKVLTNEREQWVRKPVKYWAVCVGLYVGGGGG